MIDESTFRTLDQIAAKLFAAKVFPRTVETADMAFAILLAGYELGFGPMASARGITLVSGKVSLGADATVAACAKHRDVCTYFSCTESTDDHATYVTQRAGAPAPVTLSYTIAQARRAGLAGSGTWRAHPEAMLRARCAAALARSVYPDLVAGVYDPDEAEEIRRGDAQPIVVAPPLMPANPISRIGIEHPQPHARREAPAEEPAPAPANDPARDSFVEAVDAIELPGEAVAVWLKHRDAILAMGDDDQKSARKYLAARVASVGKMTHKAAAQWCAKAIAEEDARRAAEGSSHAAA